MNNISVVKVGYLTSRNTEMSIFLFMYLTLEDSKGTLRFNGLADNGSSQIKVQQISCFNELQHNSSEQSSTM